MHLTLPLTPTYPNTLSFLVSVGFLLALTHYHTHSHTHSYTLLVTSLLDILSMWTNQHNALRFILSTTPYIPFLHFYLVCVIYTFITLLSLPILLLLFPSLKAFPLVIHFN